MAMGETEKLPASRLPSNPSLVGRYEYSVEALTDVFTPGAARQYKTTVRSERILSRQEIILEAERSLFDQLRSSFSTSPPIETVEEAVKGLFVINVVRAMKKAR